MDNDRSSIADLMMAVAAELRICEEEFSELEPDHGDPGSVWMARERAQSRLQGDLNDALLDLCRARHDARKKRLAENDKEEACED